CDDEWGVSPAIREVAERPFCAQDSEVALGADDPVRCDRSVVACLNAARESRLEHVAPVSGAAEERGEWIAQLGSGCADTGIATEISAGPLIGRRRRHGRGGSAAEPVIR